MMRVLLLCLVSSAACFPGPIYQTRHGLKVFCNESRCLGQADVEIATDVFIGLAPRGKLFEEWLARGHAALFVREAPFDCGTAKPPCAGRHYPSHAYIDVAYTECLGDGALIHELAHLYQWEVERINDVDHEDTRFFATSCTEKTSAEWVECIGASIVYQGKLLTARLTCSDES